ADGDVAHNFATLLGHLATLTRNQIVFEGGVGIDKLATPTPTQAGRSSSSAPPSPWPCDDVVRTPGPPNHEPPGRQGVRSSLGT
ncbi:MAG: hypothetical protein ACRDJ4_05295, partial [Actinomycetota bacterium]